MLMRELQDGSWFKISECGIIKSLCKIPKVEIVADRGSWIVNAFHLADGQYTWVAEETVVEVIQQPY